MKIGTRVKIVSGWQCFVGSTGYIIDNEKDGRMLMNRVELDEPVNIEGVGRVTSDLWANEYLRKIR